MTTFIHPFTFGDRTQSDLLGGKGANLAEMVQIGLPVPPGFTITTDACRQYLNANKKHIREFKEMNNVSMEQAIDGQINQYYNQYYGNANK